MAKIDFPPSNPRAPLEAAEARTATPAARVRLARAAALRARASAHGPRGGGRRLNAARAARGRPVERRHRDNAQVLTARLPRAAPRAVETRVETPGATGRKDDEQHRANYHQVSIARRALDRVRPAFRTMPKRACASRVP